MEMNYTDIEIIDKLESFLAKINLESKLKGICILTIGLDKKSLCGCFVFDYNTKKMLQHYPGRYDSNTPIYKNVNGINFTINFDYNLPVLTENGKHSGLLEDINSYPLCCKDCITKNRLTNDSEFNNFINKTNTSKYIFKITRKISFGPLEYIKYFTLNDGIIEEVPYTGIEHKINSFKIYTCKKHNTYYSIDLNTYDETSNFHHAKGQNETLFGKKILELL